MLIGSLELRHVFGRFTTGVTVVTSRIGESTHGITVNSFTSVSLDPPLVLICIDRSARAHHFIPEAGAFAINILSSKQRQVSDYFAQKNPSSREDEVSEFPYSNGLTGAPILDGIIAFVECRLSQSYSAGDHTIFVAEVVNAQQVSELQPLLFYRGSYPGLPEP